MTPFLKQIAEHYIGTAENISRLVFVFPSHRAEVFFRKYLSEICAQKKLKPFMAPKMMTVEDFFATLSGRQRADNLTLVLKLYDCYKAICLRKGLECEPLDEFLFWGDVILKDFDDIDKYQINARDLLRNVSDIKNLSDDLSYLSKTQEEAIRAFLGHFTKEGEYKMKFARLWNILGELYDDFNAALEQSEDNLCYGGSMYRALIEKIKAEGTESLVRQAWPKAEKLVFCGLNVLCKCEKDILARLKELSLAEFCWDYSSPWIQSEANKSSLFMRDNVSEFKAPQSLNITSGDKAPQINVVQVPSGVGQTKVVAQLLEKGNIPVDERTAIILPDEKLLQPLLNSIPTKVEKVNVTMGYSMACSSFFSLMCDISQLQLRLRLKDGKYYFYHKPFWNIVGNNVLSSLLDEQARQRLESLKKNKSYYIDCDAVKGSQILSVIFRPVVSDPSLASREQISQIASYQLEILDMVGSKIAQDKTLRTRFALEMDFAMEYIKSINLIDNKQLEIKPHTYFSLLDSALRSKSIPIKGEPLSGLQIMGPLETRALDFEHVFILSCNEGVFPRGEASASFIPPLLRAAFELPTYEYQDAVWAYYFYRLIQRPQSVHMLVDTRSEGMRSGEESRYIKQLRYHFDAPIKRFFANASPELVPSQDEVYKSDEDIAKIMGKDLSPSALQKYLDCPMQFYYSYVKELWAEDEVSESMDAGIIGNTYHKTMELFYKEAKDEVITREWLEALKNDKTRIKAKVESVAMDYMHSDSIVGRDIVYCRLICKYVEKTFERDLEFMNNAGVDSFRIKELEGKFKGEIGGYKVKGTLDRVDDFGKGYLRLVDYKTGKVLDEDTNIDDNNAEKIADKIFSPKTKPMKRPKIALQFYMYDKLLDWDKNYKGNTLVNCVYSTRNLLHEMPVEAYRNAKFCTEMDKRFKAKMDEIVDKKIPFVRKEEEFDDRVCGRCDYKIICGR